MHCLILWSGAATVEYRILMQNQLLILEEIKSCFCQKLKLLCFGSVWKYKRRCLPDSLHNRCEAYRLLINKNMNSDL